MKRDELEKLRTLVEEERTRRVRNNELITNPLVQEYLELHDLEPLNLDPNDYQNIIYHILDDFRITKSNGIYVCISSYIISCSVCYEDTDYSTTFVPVNSHKAEYKIYKDIETGMKKQAARDPDNHLLLKTLISDFERNNIVLNPNNTSTDSNGYMDVKDDFFVTAVTKGQAEAKKLLLKKYPRL
jgi:hypothetical protein